MEGMGLEGGGTVKRAKEVCILYLEGVSSGVGLGRRSEHEKQKVQGPKASRDG